MCALKVAALQATSLDAVLADESKTYTVFAPTDAAFAALGTDTINALLGDTETLSDILLYHVFPDAAVYAAFAKLPEGTLDALLADPETLADILFYHVIGGAAVDFTTAINLAGQSVTMANGGRLQR